MSPPCILSKEWEFRWMWLPNLDFNSLSDPKTGLGDFIDKMRPLHRAQVIESLSLHVTFNPYIKPEDVKQLEIDYYPNDVNI